MIERALFDGVHHAHLATFERHRAETLHAFLLRRHAEMVSELNTLKAQIAWQDDRHHAGLIVAQRCTAWRIAGLAVSVLLICLMGAFGALPLATKAIILAALLAGSIVSIGMPCLHGRASGFVLGRRS